MVSTLDASSPTMYPSLCPLNHDESPLGPLARSLIRLPVPARQIIGRWRSVDQSTGRSDVSLDDCVAPGAVADQRRRRESMNHLIGRSNIDFQRQQWSSPPSSVRKLSSEFPFGKPLRGTPVAVGGMLFGTVCRSLITRSRCLVVKAAGR